MYIIYTNVVLSKRDMSFYNLVRDSKAFQPTRLWCKVDIR